MRAESSSGEAWPRTRRTGTAGVCSGSVPCGSGAASSVIDFARSQRYVPVLLGWQCLAFVEQRVQGPNDPGAGMGR